MDHSDTYSSVDCLVFSADDFTNVVTQAIVANVLALQEVLRDNLVNFLLSVWSEAVLFDIELYNVLVCDEGAFKRGSVALIDLVTRDVQLLDRSIVTDVLRETFTEHVTKKVGSQVDILQATLFNSEIDAHLLSSFIIDTVQLQVEVDEGFVHFESLAEVTTTFIVDHVVTEVQVCQDLRLQQVLGNFTSTRLTNLVVRQVKLGDCLVEHETLDQDSNQVIVDQVSGEGQVSQRCGRAKAILEGGSI